MRRLVAIVSFIARGASVLPLLVYGHGTEFLDARLEVREGVVELQIVADYGGNPMIANEDEARAALADALRIEIGEALTQSRLDSLAPLTIAPRAAPDPESPMPPTIADPSQQHQLMEAKWRWMSTADKVRFFVPSSSGQSVLFWLHEPGIQPPRWSMLIGEDRTPMVAVTKSREFPWMMLSIVAAFGIGGACWRGITGRRSAAQR
jgi:hypothetical protein